MALADPQEQGERNADGTFVKGRSGNPGGRPKGSSVRAAWLRRLAKGAENDKDAAGPEDQIGELALALAEQLEMAVKRGDGEAVRALCLAIAEAEGRPQEKIEHSGTIKRVSIQLEDTPDDLEPL